MQPHFFARLAVMGGVGLLALGWGQGKSANAQLVQLETAEQLHFDAPTAGSYRLRLTALSQPPARLAESAQGELGATAVPVATDQQEPIRPPREPLGGPNAAADNSAKTLEEKTSGPKPRGGLADIKSARDPDSSAPLQNRRLSSKIAVVTIAEGEVGTGQIPVDERLLDRVPIKPLPVIHEGATFKMVHWEPSLVMHYPLYFEDAMLERHGQSRYGCLQPMVSGAKFLWTIPTLPYQYTLRPKHDCVYALGHCRPGSCAPVWHDMLPYDRHAMVVEALSLAGFFWAMPL